MKRRFATRTLPLIGALFAGGVLLIPILRWSDLHEGWLRGSLLRNPRSLLTLIEKHEWDLDRLERFVGKTEGHKLLTTLWLELLEEEHPEAFEKVSAELDARTSGDDTREWTLRISLGEGALRVDDQDEQEHLLWIAPPEEHLFSVPPVSIAPSLWSTYHEWLCSKQATVQAPFDGSGEDLHGYFGVSEFITIEPARSTRVIAFDRRSKTALISSQDLSAQLSAR